MKYAKLFALLLLAFILVSCSTGGELLQNTSVTEVEGNVRYKNPDMDEMAKIEIGTQLQKGCIIYSFSDSRAKIQLNQDSSIIIAPNSQYVIKEITEDSEGQEISLELVEGQVFIAVDEDTFIGHVDVNTPYGVASIRGSRMSVLIEAAQAVVTCLYGNCSAKNAAGETAIGQAGQAAMSAQDAAPPDSTPMAAGQVNDWFANDPKSVAGAVSHGAVDAEDLSSGCDQKSGAGCELAAGGAAGGKADDAIEGAKDAAGGEAGGGAAEEAKGAADEAAGKAGEEGKDTAGDTAKDAAIEEAEEAKDASKDAAGEAKH